MQATNLEMRLACAFEGPRGAGILHGALQQEETLEEQVERLEAGLGLMERCTPSMRQRWATAFEQRLATLLTAVAEATLEQEAPSEDLDDLHDDDLQQMLQAKIESGVKEEPPTLEDVGGTVKVEAGAASSSSDQAAWRRKTKSSASLPGEGLSRSQRRRRNMEADKLKQFEARKRARRKDNRLVKQLKEMLQKAENLGIFTSAIPPQLPPPPPPPPEPRPPPWRRPGRRR